MKSDGYFSNFTTFLFPDIISKDFILKIDKKLNLGLFINTETRLVKGSKWQDLQQLHVFYHKKYEICRDVEG